MIEEGGLMHTYEVKVPSEVFFLFAKMMQSLQVDFYLKSVDEA
jgi:hypothetical protein